MKETIVEIMFGYLYFALGGGAVAYVWWMSSTFGG